MAHEKSVTIKLDTGFWANAPSIHKGKKHTEDQVRGMILNKKIKPTSVHKSHIEAITAAKKRSKNYKKKNNGS